MGIQIDACTHLDTDHRVLRSFRGKGMWITVTNISCLNLIISLVEPAIIS